MSGSPDKRKRGWGETAARSVLMLSAAAFVALLVAFACIDIGGKGGVPFAFVFGIAAAYGVVAWFRMAWPTS